MWEANAEGQQVVRWCKPPTEMEEREGKGADREPQIQVSSRGERAEAGEDVKLRQTPQQPRGMSIRERVSTVLRNLNSPGKHRQRQGSDSSLLGKRKLQAMHDTLEPAAAVEPTCMTQRPTKENALESNPLQTYRNKDENVLGCSHYSRKCQLKASCCGKFYTCRFCHSDAIDHTMDRYATREMRCMLCGEEQEAAQNCRNCKEQMARYYCSVCKFWDDSDSKKIFHCDDCGLCRIGDGDENFHCKRCRACVNVKSKDVHVCVENSFESNCPICKEYLFDSLERTIFMRCGHSIHYQCLQEYVKYNYTCPLCSKSVGDAQTYFRMIDEVLLSDEIAPDMRNATCRVYCNDCEVRGEAKFHYTYHRCERCNGYNTRVLEVIPDGGGVEITDVSNCGDN